MTSIDSRVTLEKITGTDQQIMELYKILVKRSYNISNIVPPSFEEHVKFVQNHPYRIWYIVKTKSVYIGSAYLMKNNCVGINLVLNINLFTEVIKNLLKKHRPLREIKSVRPPYFYINISPNNEEVENQLFEINAQRIQSTFTLTPK